VRDPEFKSNVTGLVSGFTQTVSSISTQGTDSNSGFTAASNFVSQSNGYSSLSPGANESSNNRGHFGSPSFEEGREQTSNGLWSPQSATTAQKQTDAWLNEPSSAPQVVKVQSQKSTKSTKSNNDWEDF
jgi:hypothetical protein